MPVFEIYKSSTGQTRTLILSHDCESWQEWLAEARKQNLSLAEANFDRLPLRGLDFSGLTLTDATFGAADIRECDFSAANLSGAVMSRCEAERANFTTACLHYAVARAANFSQCSFIRANCHRGVFCSANFSLAFLQAADFRNAVMQDALVAWAFRNLDTFSMSQLQYYCDNLHMLLYAHPALCRPLHQAVAELRFEHMNHLPSIIQEYVPAAEAQAAIADLQDSNENCERFWLCNSWFGQFSLLHRLPNGANTGLAALEDQKARAREITLRWLEQWAEAAGCPLQTHVVNDAVKPQRRNIRR